MIEDKGTKQKKRSKSVVTKSKAQSLIINPSAQKFKLPLLYQIGAGVFAFLNVFSDVYSYKFLFNIPISPLPAGSEVGMFFDFIIFYLIYSYVFEKYIKDGMSVYEIVGIIALGFLGALTSLIIYGIVAFVIAKILNKKLSGLIKIILGIISLLLAIILVTLLI